MSDVSNRAETKFLIFNSIKQNNDTNEKFHNFPINFRSSHLRISKIHTILKPVLHDQMKSATIKRSLV